MTEEEFKKEEYESRIAELEKQLQEAQNNDDGLDEIKNKYQKIIDDKDQQIKELNKTVETNKKKVDNTVDDLNKEVEERLKQSEAYKDLQEKLHKLEKERAETVVDTYINRGVLLPVQRDAAVDLCLNDNDTFMKLYQDAKPIVNTNQERKSISTGTAERIANYLNTQ
jgi:chromosome segregation ATPase